MITLELFDQQLRATWDDIVSKARNGLFQFQRNYLEYHKLRFTDASVLFRKGANPIGCLPMSRHEDTLISHGGLTFGGILTLPEARLTHVRDMLRLAKDFAKQSNCRKILYKSIPRIYHRNPSDEDLYCLFLEGGRLVRRDLNTVLEYGRSARVHARRSRAPQSRSDRELLSRLIPLSSPRFGMS